MGAAQAVCDQVQRQVVASHGHNGPLNRLGRAKELHRHLRSGVEPLGEAGNTQKAVGPDQRHDHTGAALDRGRYRTLPDPAQAHPKELVLAHGRGYLPGEPRFDAAAAGLGRAQHALDQRFHEYLARQRRRHRVAGNAQQGLALRDSQHDRVPGPDGGPVNHEEAQVLHDPGRVVLRPGGGARVHQGRCR